MPVRVAVSNVNQTNDNDCKILDVSTPIPIQLNLTGIFLRDFSELDFDLLGGKENREKSKALTPSALSTVGLRKATESHSVMIYNFTGLDIEVDLADSMPSSQPESSVRFDSVGPGLIKNTCCVSLDASCFAKEAGSLDLAELKSRLCLRLSKSAAETVGERETVLDLPILTNVAER